MTQNQNTCNVCNQPFKTEEELRQHQRNAHGSEKHGGEKKEQGDRPTTGDPQHRKEDKIAS